MVYIIWTLFSDSVSCSLCTGLLNWTESGWKKVRANFKGDIQKIVWRSHKSSRTTNGFNNWRNYHVISNTQRDVHRKNSKTGSFITLVRHFFSWPIMLSILEFTGEDIIKMDVKGMLLAKDRDHWQALMDIILWEVVFLDRLRYCPVFKKCPARRN